MERRRSWLPIFSLLLLVVPIVHSVASFSQQTLALSEHSQVWSPLLEGFPESPKSSKPQSPSTGRHRVNLHPDGNVQYGEISLGTPSQVFNVAFDTFTSDLWVPAKAPGTHHLYNHSASSTYQANGSYFNSPYASGILSSEVLRIGDVNLPNQYFGEANNTSPLGPGYPLRLFDGVFGLGFDATSLAQVETPLDHMMRLGLLNRKMFAVYSGNNGNLGELMLGDYDANHFKGELTYFNTASPVSWSIWLDKVQVGDLTLSDGSAATLWTMGRLIFGLSDEISQIAEALGGKEEIPGAMVYSIDCASNPPDVTFVLDGHPFSISKDEYVLRMEEKCRLAFMGGVPSWALGTAFLSKFYAVFDMDSEVPRIGLALAT